MHIQVECYAGYRGEETPRYIRMATYTIEIKEVVDRWIAPDHRYFKIIGTDDATYIIRHETATWQWELVFYQSEKGISSGNCESGES
ncbi:MAG: hypothetical protein KJP23_21155 [Deltaproteobacteria bacterium]|nr:hypothetical protein [Deltaproteobacteria bacterium]